MVDIYAVYSTFGSRDEAFSVAKALLEARLVACVNIMDGVQSLYRWEGEIRQEPEVMLVAKTSGRKLQAASEMIKQLHSYELPCIIAYQIAGGFPPFLGWIQHETT